MAGGWYLLFSLPLIFMVPDTHGQGKPLRRALRDGIAQLVETARGVHRFAHIARFLVARMIYIDALATIFALGGVYAAGAFQMSEREVLLFGIVVNFAAGLGALSLSKLDDKIGSLTHLSGSQRVGMSIVIVLLLVGGGLMLKVQDPP